MATRLASLNQVKSFLRIPTTETALDDILAEILEAVSDDCESFCGRSFAAQSVVREAYDGGGESLCVRNFPVDEDADFELFTTGFYTTIESGFYTEVQLLDTQFLVDYAQGIVSLQAGLRFPTERNSVFITYTGGYSVTGDLSYPDAETKVNVPLQMQEAVKVLCGARYKFQQNSITLEVLEENENYARKKWAPYVRTS